MTELKKSLNSQNIDIRWTPDKTSSTPIYTQIVQYITDRIRSGDWVEGDRLPSQRRMADAFGVNRSTIVTAMEELISYGIVEGSHGGGTRITGGSWSLTLAQPPDWNTFIQSGHFLANKPTIQMINKMEYEEDYVRIGTGELSPSLYPNELAAKILRELPDSIPSLNYLEGLGLPALRKTLCDYLLDKHGIKAKPENILITSGSLQALQLISLCLLKRGSTVYTESPSYLKSLEVFQSAGMNMAGLPMDEEGIRFSSLKGKNLKDSLIYTIPSFHNPTSRIMSEGRRRSLLNFVSEHKLPLIEDDAYAELWMEKKPPKPIKSIDESGNVLYLGTLSKTIAPGLRIGWVVGPEAVVYRLGDVKMQTDYGSSSVSQWMASKLLMDPEYEKYLTDLRGELRIRRDLALEACEEYLADLCTWETPRGGFYIWLRFAHKLPMEMIFREALDQGILFNPGNVYDYGDNNAIRLSYAYADPEDLRKGIEILGGIIRKHIGE